MFLHILFVVAAVAVSLVLFLAALFMASLYAWHFLLWREVTVRWLQRKEKRDPNNPRWPSILGLLYYARMWRKSGSARREAARHAVMHYERWLILHGDITHDYSNLTKLAMSAVEAEMLSEAKKYALQLLKLPVRHKTQRFGNAIHYGNIVLGRLALRRGETAEAGAFLLKAGATPGSPQLDSYGPSMLLANELLQARERDVVLRYFELCASFWAMNRQRGRFLFLQNWSRNKHRILLKQWVKDVEADKIPNFGRNLAR